MGLEIEKVAELNEKNIRLALADYRRHTSETSVLDDVSDPFITRLAKDSAKSKTELRELFRKSPVWDEQLQALIINGTRTHDPDARLVDELAGRLLEPAVSTEQITHQNWYKIRNFFVTMLSPTPNQDIMNSGIAVIQTIAPKAYAPGKKLSRVFKGICDALGLTDNTVGSSFQRVYAQFADELTARKISFKLFVSINPAHFLTMSNPKHDERGCTLTSCHSFNSTEYQYNCGCSGYARDETSFIVFTVDDPSDAELLNNRKTTRQVFAYKPGNGVLMQSRLYNTSGGTHGAQEDSKLYRDLIQREISNLENAPNLWKTQNSYSGAESALIRTGAGFGGYSDWTYSDFDGKISIRSDHENDCESISVGTYGLCICCGAKIESNLYCEFCNKEDRCEECGEYFNTDRLTEVHFSNGETGYVCDDCLERYYRYCDRCHEYFPIDDTRYVDSTDECVCNDCFDEYYEQCDDCHEAFLIDDLNDAQDSDGDTIRVCEDCLKNGEYDSCGECGDYVTLNGLSDAFDEHGETIRVCPTCSSSMCSFCVDCAELYLNRALNAQGRCPKCEEEASDVEEEPVDELVKEGAV